MRRVMNCAVILYFLIFGFGCSSSGGYSKEYMKEMIVAYYNLHPIMLKYESSKGCLKFYGSREGEEKCMQKKGIAKAHISEVQIVDVGTPVKGTTGNFVPIKAVVRGNVNVNGVEEVVTIEEIFYIGKNEFGYPILFDSHDAFLIKSKNKV